MTQDLNSNISLVEYNSLNLPSRIEFMDGSSARYTYDATEGNCNTSTTSLLKNAGVPQNENNRIGKNIKAR